MAAASLAQCNSRAESSGIRGGVPRGAGRLGGSAGAALDPDENISTDHHAGEHRERFLAVFRNGEWGVKGRGCGGGTLVSWTESGVRLGPRLCDRWECEACGPRRAAWLKRNLNAQVASGALTSFWTLTIRTSACSAAESYPYITASWNRLRTTLSRVFPDLEYTWTRESTERGYAHLHLLTNKSLCEHCLGQEWLKSTGSSWITDVSPIHSTRAADYLSKYCVEQALSREAFKLIRGSKPRTFSKSAGIEFDPFRPKKGSGWTKVLRMPYHVAVAEFGRVGALEAEKVFGVPWARVQLAENVWPTRMSASSYEREVGA